MHSRIFVTSSADRNCNVLGFTNIVHVLAEFGGRFEKSIFVFQNLRQLDGLRNKEFVDPYPKDFLDLSKSDGSDDEH